jgi:hypothetical protein
MKASQHAAYGSLSARRFAPCQHARPAASLVSTPASQAFSYFPFRPRPVANEVPLLEAVGFGARGDAPRRLAESEPEGRSVLTSEGVSLSVLTSGGVSLSVLTSGARRA